MRKVEKFFLKLVKKNKLKLYKNGKYPINLRTRNILGIVEGNVYPKISWKDYKKDKIRSILLHRLIWIFYKGEIPRGKEINHKNGNKSDFKLTNLEIVTSSENQEHAYKTNLKISLKGKQQPNTKINEDDVKKLRKEYEKGNISINDVRNKYKVSKNTAWQMLTRRTFKHIE